MISKVGAVGNIFEYEAVCDRCGFSFDSEEELAYGDFIREIRDCGWIFRKTTGELDETKWSLLCPRGFSFDSEDEVAYRDFIGEIRDCGWKYHKTPGELDEAKWIHLCPRCANLR